MNQYIGLVRIGIQLMPGIVAIRLRLPVITCFPAPETRNLNHLVLVTFCFARATRAAAWAKRRQPAAAGNERSLDHQLASAKSAAVFGGSPRRPPPARLRGFARQHRIECASATDGSRAYRDLTNFDPNLLGRPAIRRMLMELAVYPGGHRRERDRADRAQAAIHLRGVGDPDPALRSDVGAADGDRHLPADQDPSDRRRLDLHRSIPVRYVGPNYLLLRADAHDDGEQYR